MAEAIRSEGGKAEYCRLDVASPEQWRDAIAAVARAYGGLHVLVNNAGIPLRGVGMMTTPLADWQRVLDVNLTGVFIGIQAAAPLIRDSGGGSIINIGSAAGMTGNFATAYSTAKWGLRGLTKSAALELADWKIRVNAIHPGIVDTPLVAGSDDFVAAMKWMTPLDRVGQSEDIAAAVLFLAGDGARFITGIDMPVDGGLVDLATYRAVIRRVRESPSRRV